MDDQQEAPPDEQPRTGWLDAVVGDDTTQKKVAVAALAAFVVLAAAGGFAWGHLPVVVGCWVGSGSMLLCAWLFGWEPPPPPEVTYTFQEPGVPPLMAAPQPMRQPGPPGQFGPGQPGRRVG